MYTLYLLFGLARLTLSTKRAAVVHDERLVALRDAWSDW
jgi:hypothetical protein